MTITTLMFLMGFLVFAVVGLGLGLWRMVRLSRDYHPAVPAPRLRPRSYGPMARLFDGRDLEFLVSQPGYRPDMARRLRLARRAALSLYLRQAREDYRACSAAIRSSATFGESSELAHAAIKQALVFNGLYLLLRLQCLAAALFYFRTSVGGLLAVLQPLQRRARGAAAEPAARVAASH